MRTIFTVIITAFLFTVVMTPSSVRAQSSDDRVSCHKQFHEKQIFYFPENQPECLKLSVDKLCSILDNIDNDNIDYPKMITAVKSFASDFNNCIVESKAYQNNDNTILDSIKNINTDNFEKSIRKLLISIENTGALNEIEEGGKKKLKFSIFNSEKIIKLDQENNHSNNDQHKNDRSLNDISDTIIINALIKGDLIKKLSQINPQTVSSTKSINIFYQWPSRIILSFGKDMRNQKFYTLVILVVVVFIIIILANIFYLFLRKSIINIFNKNRLNNSILSSDQAQLDSKENGHDANSNLYPVDLEKFMHNNRNELASIKLKMDEMKLKMDETKLNTDEMKLKIDEIHAIVSEQSKKSIDNKYYESSSADVQIKTNNNYLHTDYSCEKIMDDYNFLINNKSALEDFINRYDVNVVIEKPLKDFLSLNKTAVINAPDIENAEFFLIKSDQENRKWLLLTDRNIVNKSGFISNDGLEAAERCFGTFFMFRERTGTIRIERPALISQQGEFVTIEEKGLMFIP